MRSLPRVRSLPVVLALCIFCLSLPFPALAGQTVDINGPVTVNGTVYGNGSGPNNTTMPPIPTFEAEGNSVNISGSTVDAVIGGGAGSADGAVTAQGNSVNVSGAKVDSNVYGGRAKSTGGDAAANGNSVSISNGSTVYFVIGGLAESTSGAATAQGNSVNISNGATAWSVSGGNAESLSGAGMVQGNSVNISNGAAIGSNVYGGYATSSTNTATAGGNSVNINGAALAADVYGGYADSNGAGMSGDAVNNRVVISNGQIGMNIYGGFSHVDTSLADTGSATGNSVTLMGAPLLNGSLYGGFVGSFNPLTPAPGTDAFSGNTLLVAPSLAGGISVGGSGAGSGDVQNFEFYNFTFQKDAAMNSVGLNAAGTVYLNDGGSRASVIQSVNIQGGGSPLSVGHSFLLINAAGNLNAAPFNQTTAGGKKGVTLLYDYDLALAGQTLTATVTGIQAHPEAKALSEGWLGGLVLVTQGADLIAGQGMSEAVQAARAGAAGSAGFGSFGALSGGWSRYNTVSHIPNYCNNHPT